VVEEHPRQTIPTNPTKKNINRPSLKPIKRIIQTDDINSELTVPSSLSTVSGETSCVTELSSHIDAESSGLNDSLFAIEMTLL